MHKQSLFKSEKQKFETDQKNFEDVKAKLDTERQEFEAEKKRIEDVTATNDDIF